MRRLVSAYYGDWYPFGTLRHIFSELVETSDPLEIQLGDCLIVWGGADIHPDLYGKMRSPQSGAAREPSHRDRIEWALMQRCIELGNPIIGVCRGGQMLCAAAGGFLVQHVNNHGGRHQVLTHDGEEFTVNSIHHQMMNPFGVDHELIAWTKNKLSDVYWDEDNKIEMPLEPEMVWFPQVKGFAIQWHPEMLAEEGAANQYVLSFIEEKLTNA